MVGVGVDTTGKTGLPLLQAAADTAAAVAVCAVVVVAAAGPPSWVTVSPKALVSFAWTSSWSSYSTVPASDADAATSKWTLPAAGVPALCGDAFATDSTRDTHDALDPLLCFAYELSDPDRSSDTDEAPDDTQSFNFVRKFCLAGIAFASFPPRSRIADTASTEDDDMVNVGDEDEVGGEGAGAAIAQRAGKGSPKPHLRLITCGDAGTARWVPRAPKSVGGLGRPASRGPEAPLGVPRVRQSLHTRGYRSTQALFYKSQGRCGCRAVMRVHGRSAPCMTCLTCTHTRKVERMIHARN